MTRRIGLALALALALAALGCEGVLREKPTGLAGDGGGLGQPMPPPCDPPAAPAGDGHHHPGESCLGCHQSGMDPAPPFTFAGTLFAGPDGAAPVAGGTIHLIDALGVDLVVVTAANGNFYSTEPVAFPATAFSATCPDVAPMITPINDDDASCNRSGCHAAGFRVH